jgi:hypothetical protein
MHDLEPVAEAVRLRDEEGLGARKVASGSACQLALPAIGTPATASRSTGTREHGDACSRSMGRARSMNAAFWAGGCQQQFAERWPEALIRGLIQSDGCRFINTGRDGWRHPRYVFSNVASDITSIFCTACDCLDLRWTAAESGSHAER